MLSAIGVAFFVYIWRWYHRARIIEDTPTANIRSAHQGYVEIEGLGRMIDGEPIHAPLTNKQCLWFRFKVEEQQLDQSDRSSNPHWRVVRSATSEHLFSIDDGTGICVVDPDGAEVTPNEKQIWYGNDPWPQNNPALTTVGGALFGMGRFRYTEERLRPSRLYAIGWFSSISQVDGEISNDVTALLRQWKRDTTGLLKRFDTNRDGDIDNEEWETAVEQATIDVLKNRAERSRGAHIHTLLKPPHKNRPFIISPNSQDELIRRYKRKSFAAMLGVFVIVGILLWTIAARA